jgi:holo-[acyl-carrier protein] synthase
MFKSGLIGIGVDILHIPRLTEAIQRRGLKPWIQKILTSAEANEMARGNKNPIVYLATRISAKEAIYKALWPRWSKTWKSVSILNVNSKPMVHQEGLKEKEFECHISISHDANFVIAFAVVYEL